MEATVSSVVEPPLENSSNGLGSTAGVSSESESAPWSDSSDVSSGILESNERIESVSSRESLDSLETTVHTHRREMGNLPLSPVFHREVVLLPEALNWWGVSPVSTRGLVCVLNLCIVVLLHGFLGLAVKRRSNRCCISAGTEVAGEGLAIEPEGVLLRVPSIKGKVIGSMVFLECWR